MSSFIHIEGARANNLKGVSLDIPRDKFVVVTGLSGSGKSTLAFDTICAEGRRRYLDTLSPYAKHFIGYLDKPNVESIEGLSPIISIEQKTTGNNPRSTVGTITEIYDFLRLLFAKASVAYSPATGKPMVQYTDEQIVDLLLSRYEGRRCYLLAPLVSGRKGHYKELFAQMRKRGYTHIRVDGTVCELVEIESLDRYKNHFIELVVDRLKPSSEDLARIRKSVETALNYGKGSLCVLDDESQQLEYFSKNLVCPDSGLSLPLPQPFSFSFNSPQGYCPRCKGLGVIGVGEPDEIEPVPVEMASLMEEELDDKQEKRVCPLCEGRRLKKETAYFRIDGKTISEVADMEISLLQQWLATLEDKMGRRERLVAHDILRELRDRVGFLVDVGLDYLSLSRATASLSGGESQRIRLATQIGSRLVNVLYILDEPSIGLHQRDNRKLIASLRKLRDEGNGVMVVEHDAETMLSADWLVDVGPGAGKDGGEICYNGPVAYADHRPGWQASHASTPVLRTPPFRGTPFGCANPGDSLLRFSDENLADAASRRLMASDDGAAAISVGPSLHDAASRRLTASGAVTDGSDVPALEQKSLTLKYLRGERKIEVPAERRKGNGKTLRLEGCTGNNLKNVDVEIPLGCMVGVCGVSGSGKSTFINETLVPVLSNKYMRTHEKALPYGAVHGLENLDKIIVIDQDPIGKTPRSNPATFTGVFTEIRNLFENTPDARARGFKSGRFSFNVPGGRCEACKGAGLKLVEMNYLPSVHVVCPECAGKRYNEATLAVRYKGKSIGDVLEMPVSEACEFFEKVPKIARPLRAMKEVGLGYIRLGQSTVMLSGGECQRIKLAAELARPGTGKTLYVLDEPTTGLHFEDIRILLETLGRLADKGNSILIIEHNLDVLKNMDWLIDMGPDGGYRGGKIVAQGTPEQLAENPASVTGPFLKEIL